MLEDNNKVMTDRAETQTETKRKRRWAGETEGKQAWRNGRLNMEDTKRSNTETRLREQEVN